MSSLSGKRYWVVGASAGIGRALSFHLAQCGASVVATARNQGDLDSLMNLMPTHAGREHKAIPADVTDMTTIRAAFDQAGPIDGVIYCAGAYEPMAATRPSIKQLETIIDVNLTGALRVLASAVPAFVSRNSGHVLLVGSLAGYRGLPDAWGYGASKAAIIHLAENLSCDLRGSGIKIQVCNPGFVVSRLTDKNSFRMPFLMSPQQAARRIVRGMSSQRFEIAFPFPMVAAFKLLTLLPPKLHFSLMGRSPKHSTGIET